MTIERVVSFWGGSRVVAFVVKGISLLRRFVDLPPPSFFTYNVEMMNGNRELGTCIPLCRQLYGRSFGFLCGRT